MRRCAVVRWERRCRWCGRWQGRCRSPFKRLGARINGSAEVQPPSTRSGARAEEKAAPLIVTAPHESENHRNNGHGNDALETGLSVTARWVRGKSVAVQTRLSTTRWRSRSISVCVDDAFLHVSIGLTSISLYVCPLELLRSCVPSP
jgi:hypothetical protein